MTYTVFGGMLNPAQVNSTLPKENLAVNISGILHIGCCTCHLTHNVKAPKGTQNTEVSQTNHSLSGIIIPSFTTGLLKIGTQNYMLTLLTLLPSKVIM